VPQTWKTIWAENKQDVHIDKGFHDSMFRDIQYVSATT